MQERVRHRRGMHDQHGQPKSLDFVHGIDCARRPLCGRAAQATRQGRVIAMQRRELIQLIAAITGCAFAGHDASWAAGDTEAPLPYSDSDVDFLGDVADTILPTTDTPGARDAAVGQFIARYSAACYPLEHIALLKSGISDIDAQMQVLQGKGFRQANTAAEIFLLQPIEPQAKE